MTNRLHQLYEVGGQSPWLDNLRRGWLRSGELAAWVERGVRGLTSNPTIFAKAMSEGDDYDEDRRALAARGASIESIYWSLVVGDIEEALSILRPVHDQSDGLDGFVSLEVDPGLANDAAGTIAAARDLHDRIDQPNLYVKIPATAPGVEAIRQMISERRSINVTLIFSIDRYREVIEAYLAGLEAASGDLSQVSSVASFFVSRVDTEVDRRLDAIGDARADALKGRAAVANARVAYRVFRDAFRGPRWDALVARGARVQRPLWASTSTKNPDYPDTFYVDDLIGPDTVNTLPDATIAAFLDHGTVARTIDADLAGAERALAELAEVGVDLDDVTATLESEGVAAFEKSFTEVLESISSVR